ncbi:hypothetical protein FSARC_14734 [Fusarium sarcochroum]|uniref:Heterokaryon incompatibility domain-containing protein n=1 Tax=Fusarium sarcochroum TaxID=1208366 RepID=A0A8H4SRN2_9HYPO|nr:hypothetical protein FSARC_14734 [Fusarium sarcochroum]
MSMSIALALTLAILASPVSSSTQPNSDLSHGVIAERGSEDNYGGTTGTIHGVIMSIVFLLGFPIGSLLMPLVGKWLIHASWQIIVFIGMCAGFGIGKIAADRTGDWISDPHVQLGTFVCVLIVIQPILGWIHHRNYIKYQRRTKISHGHIWFGRVLMVIGIINGGTGLQLSGASTGPIVAYSVIGVIVFSVYTVGVIFKEVKLRRKETDEHHSAMAFLDVELCASLNLTTEYRDAENEKDRFWYWPEGDIRSINIRGTQIGNDFFASFLEDRLANDSSSASVTEKFFLQPRPWGSKLDSRSPAESTITPFYAEYELHAHDEVFEAGEKTDALAKGCDLFCLVQDLYKIWCRSEKAEENMYLISCQPYVYSIATHPNVWPALQASSEAVVLPDPLGAVAVTRMSHWIKECNENHQQCRKEDIGFCPTRLLDVGRAESNGLIRLIEPVNEVVDYIALSHCWGESTSFIITQESIHQMRLGFQANDEVPKTFCDAIRVARKLGIRYVWIDSLCIVQGDIKDWEREASRMAEVYQNAYLTIGALSASDDRDGFLNPRKAPTWELRVFTSMGHSANIYLRPQGDTMTLGMQPLDRRAWTLQEQYLSRRQLRFARNKILWRCQQIRQDESDEISFNAGGREWYNINELIKPSQPGDGVLVHYEWYHTVHHYSARKLSIDTDRLPALSGLAATVAKHRGNRYCAGMWWEDIGYVICWHISGWTIDEPARATRGYVAPSWSWASIIGRISFPNQGGSGFLWPEPLRSVKYLDYNLDYQSNNKFGQLERGWLLLRAPTVSFFKLVTDETGTNRYGVEYIEDFNQISVKFDLPEFEGDQIFGLILIRATLPMDSKNLSEKSKLLGVVVQRAGEEELESYYRCKRIPDCSNVLRRIGYFDVVVTKRQEKQLLEEAVEETALI